MVNIIHRNYRFAAVIERDADGYFAYCPELQGCYTQGSNHEEALRNLQSAIQLVVEDTLECGEEIHQTVKNQWE
jgi:predicted RNase H-like HicB family nuclease